MRAATEGSLPPVMPQGNLVEVLGREVRQGSPGELMVESTPSRQRRPPCKTNKEESDEAADAAALTYLLTYLLASSTSCALFWMNWSWLGMWGKGGRPDTEYDWPGQPQKAPFSAKRHRIRLGQAIEFRNS